MTQHNSLLLFSCAHIIYFTPPPLFFLSLLSLAVNLHVPQDFGAISEVKHIMSVVENIVSPQKNQPCIAYVQDALVAAYKLTHISTFVVPSQFMYIRTFAHYCKDKPIPSPAIQWKDKEGQWHYRYTGKQIFSFICPSINLTKKVRGLEEKTYFDVKERFVVIRQGKLLCGQLCKNTLGSSHGGVTHIICLDIGNQEACNFLSDSGRVMTAFFEEQGFSVGIRDIWQNQNTHDAVSSIVTESLDHIEDTLDRIQNVPESLVENYVSDVLGKILRYTGQTVVGTLHRSNALVCMSKGIGSGSKGSKLNVAQIGGAIGQTTVQGKRIHAQKGDRTLPCYRTGCRSPLAHGFCPNSYSVGLTPSEFYFHAMGGREGLVATAVKTGK